MFAVQALPRLRTWFCQACNSFYTSVLCHQLMNTNTVRNNGNVSVKKKRLKMNVIKSNIETRQLFGPVIRKKKNGTRMMKKRQSLLNSNKNDINILSEVGMNLSETVCEKNTDKLIESETTNLLTGDKAISELSETEMEKLENVIYNILLLKMLSSSNIQSVKKRTAKVCNLSLPQVSEHALVKPIISSEKLESLNSSLEVNKTDSLEISFPLCNIVKHKSQEGIVDRKSTIPMGLSIGKDKISSSNVLISTQSTSSNRSGSHNITLCNEEKLTLESKLCPYVMEYLQNNIPADFPDPDLPANLLGYWRSLQSVLKKITHVERCNVKTTHPALHYTAAADIICSYNGHLVMLDWKTHIGLTNSSVNVNDYSLLAMACVGALNFDDSISLEEPLHAVLVVAYPSGKPAHALFMKSALANLYWTNWLQRLSMFYRRRKELL